MKNFFLGINQNLPETWTNSKNTQL